MLIDTTDILGHVGESQVFEAEFCPEPVGEGLSQVEFKPMTAHVTVRGTEEGAVALISVTGQARAYCDRCLKSLCLPLRVESGLEIRQEEDPEDEDTLAPDEEGQVDLGPFLREIILVSLPMKLLCDIACSGLCHRCGRDLNEGDCGCDTSSPDPRLAVLESIRDRLDEGSES